MSKERSVHQNNRLPYEFDFNTKTEALERSGYKCEKCGKQDSDTERLEVNHAIAIWFAREIGGALPAELIRSLANAQVLCKDCHAKYHIDESRSFYAELAPKILQVFLDNTINPHLDDWRDAVRKKYYSKGSE